jgi:hypothetical protein
MHSGLYTTPDEESGRILKRDFSYLEKCTLMTKCPEIEGVYCNTKTYQQFMDLAKPTDPRLDISYESYGIGFVPFGLVLDDANEILKRYYKDEIPAEVVCEFWFRRLNLDGLYPNGFTMPSESALQRNCRLYDLSESEVLSKLKKLAETNNRMWKDGYVFIDNEFHQLQED